MDSEIKVLVLGAGSNVSQGIIKSLRMIKRSIKIFGACISEYSKGIYLCDEGYICPRADDEQFISWVVEFCNNHKIDIIFTGVEENVLELARNIDVLKQKTKSIFISSSYEQLLLGQDKFFTCEFLKNAGCNFPKYQLYKGMDSVREFARRVGYPIIAKPRNGKSANGIVIIKNENDINNCSGLDDYVLEEYVGSNNEEYTVGCYRTRNDELKMIIMKRLLHNGTTVWAKVVEDNMIYDECRKICESFNPIGPLNIQLRKNDDGQPICFEMNVRFSGTTAMRNHMKFRDVEAMIDEYLFDLNVSNHFDYINGEMFRYDEEFYLQDGSTEKLREFNQIEKNMFLLESRGNNENCIHYGE